MDDIDSLFEGMVLFNPNEEEPPQQPLSLDPRDLETPDSSPVVTVEESPPITLDSESSDPLDESLFSDLTIVTADPSPAAYIRQVSRKKKRASLRIGYGRNLSSVAVEDEDGDDRPRSGEIDGDREEEVISTISGAGDEGGEDRSLHVVADGIDAENRAPSGEIDRDGDGDEEEGGLGRIKARIAAELESARRSAAKVSEARKAAIMERRRASEKLRESAMAYADLERLLDEVCESEDFEAAERLSDSLAAVDAERASLAAALRDAEADYDAVEARMEAALAAQIAAEENCASILHVFSQDASSKAESMISTAQEASTLKLEKWNSSTEALELRRMELEIKSQIVDEARAGLDSSVEHLVGDDKKERESLCKKKEVLVDELQKLCLLVKQKEQEIAETDLDIEAVDERISSSVSGFQGMRSNIESKLSDLQSGLSEIEVEAKELLTEKKEIDEVLAREEEEGAKLRELAKASAEEAKEYLDLVGLRKNLMVSVLKSRENKVRLAKIEEKLSDEVLMLQNVISTSRLSLQELSTRKSSIQQDITSAKQKLLFTDKRIPELEAEKRVAASARNFKEAARIAAEAKSLSVEKDEVQASTERAVSELAKLEAEIDETAEKIQSTENLVSSKQKEAAMARFERLVLVAGSGRAERAAALELGNREEADLLHEEAEAADSEADSIKPVYDFKLEDFANVPKHFISIELVANLGKTRLQELASMVQIS